MRTHPSHEFLEVRERAGLDRFDEVWDGVLHINSPPTTERSSLQNRLQHSLTVIIEDRGFGRVLPQSGVRMPGSGLKNYRIPDISVVSNGRASIEHDGWLNGGPDLVVEIRSPDDETYDKLPFYAKLNVSEVLVVDSNQKRPELLRVVGDKYLAIAHDSEGWLALETFPLVVRCANDRLEVQDSALRARP